MSRRFTLFEARDRPPAPPPSLTPDCGMDRRRALALLSSGMAAALAGCGKPTEHIVPYVDQPPGLYPGLPQRYATALTLNGYARGAITVATDGRPIKIEGSPRHPYSLGSTDVFAEAEILSLYDPLRAEVLSNADGPTDWAALQAVLFPRLAVHRKDGGGFTLLTGRTVSPTELRLVDALRSAYPGMTWRRFEPVNDDAERAGARMAFGRPLTVLPDLASARVVLCLDADPLGPGPEQIVHGRGFVAGRSPGEASFSRLYVAEAGWSQTGAAADHRTPLHPALIRNIALVAAGALGAPVPQTVELPPDAARFAHACAADLKAHPGQALVLAGRSQAPDVHALCHWINARLRARAKAIAPLDPNPDDHGASLDALAQDLHAGRVQTLAILGANPAYDAPPGLEMAQAISRAGFSVHFGAYRNETSALCTWQAPLSHALESWGDARAPDGSAALVQPLIRPLHDSLARTEALAMLGGAVAPSAYALMRRTWASTFPDGAGAIDDLAFKQALTAGVIEGAAPAPVTPPAPKWLEVRPAQPTGGFTLALSPDPSVFDGQYAENAWLQECPKPITSEVWGASLHVSPQDAASLGLSDFDHVRLSRQGRSVTASIRVRRGQAVGVLSGFIGGGRREAGGIGTGVGQDFTPLRSLDALWTAPVQVEKVPGHGGPPSFQALYRLDGDARKLSPLLSVAKLASTPRMDRDERPPTLLPPEQPWAPAWAMVIDQASCIGCNACVVACQAENNVPVVGPEEVARGRDMHWLRIDTYDVGDDHTPRPAFQPVPCMQCEHAPCEPVCPVEASIHDHEGLNDQVYNRCIGTRFCQSNCPYKVRRFNWFGYGHDQAYANLGDAAFDALKNPEVTVRARGVMEKCTYCVQRISAARRLAEREDREIGPHEVVTACQSACPTQAIRFGDKSDPRSGLEDARRDPRHFVLLEEEGTRPRTTYLARMVNPNPALGEMEA